jgi:hypothetical protein
MKEADQLRSALTIMSRFSGAPQFEWVDELRTQLKAQFHLEDNNNPIISFESNHYLKGKELIGELFDTILNKIVLDVSYQDFKSPEPYTVLFHPYYLKQYNGRWFVFGYDELINQIRNLALDRIQGFNKTPKPYKESEIIWENEDEGYFDDIIGVSKPYEGEIQTIEKNSMVENLSDEEVIKILNKFAKNCKENIRLANDEKSKVELEVIESYLPKQLSAPTTTGL